jgi:hypothetical protein
MRSAQDSANEFAENAPPECHFGPVGSRTEAFAQENRSNRGRQGFGA